LAKKLNKEYLNVAECHKLPINTHDYLASFIGDGIGDDFMDTLVSKEEAQEITNILLRNNLST